MLYLACVGECMRNKGVFTVKNYCEYISRDIGTNYNIVLFGSKLKT
jgi:hypothetical protein